MLNSASWDFLNHFIRPPPQTISWDAVRPFLQVAAEFAVASSRDVQQALDEWDKQLASIDGDPARHDWSRFRPLRLAREEAWADWLAHLLEISLKGHFASRLLLHEPNSDVRVEREVATPGVDDEVDRRLDIVVHWHGDDYTHLELKVGDASFSKTTPTARSIQNHQPGKWQHVLLVPPQDESDARSAIEADDSDQLKIVVMTWRHVATTIRTCLWSGCGSVAWRVSARMLLGAIEQRLLFVGPVRRGAAKIRNAPLMLALLEEARHECHV